MFLKRLSRGSRANSYAEDPDLDRPRSQGKYNAGSNANAIAIAASAEQANLQQHNNFGPASPTKESTKDMYPRPHGPQDVYSHQRNGLGSRQNSGAFEPMGSGPLKMEATPDPLTRAFNEALRPYTDKIEQLEMQLGELQNFVDQLERQRSEMHSWIDKRGLRPDVPPSIAKAMDAQPESAVALNAQLDRKITIVNFDLHRLQDDLNDTISSAHFASAMSKFLPDISRLASLPGGARFAFELVLKLGGNLDSHGGLDSTRSAAEAAADLAARRDFYAQLDGALVDVVRRRFQDAGDAEWPVGREIKRIEKRAAQLRNYGIEPYYPQTLEAMRRELDFRQAAPPGGQALPAGSPPKY